MSKIDELVKKQRKLTTAANTIQNELLTYTADASLLTGEQKKTLYDAIAILRESKLRYQHKKEKEARAELKHKRDLKTVENINHTVAVKLVNGLGIKSCAALIFYEHRTSAKTNTLIHPDKCVPAYFKHWLSKAQCDHDDLLTLVSEIKRAAVTNIKDVIIPDEYKVFRGSFANDDYDPNYYHPQKLTYDIGLDFLHNTLSYNFSEEAFDFINEVVRLVELSNGVTENLQELFRQQLN